MTRLNIAYALNGLENPREALQQLNRAERTISAMVEGGSSENDRAIGGTALPRLLNLRADTYLDLGQPRRALADLDRIADFITVEANRPEVIGMYVTRARALADLGQMQSSAEQIEMAKSLGEPPTPLIAYLLASTEAEVASATGRYRTAYAAAQRASDLRDELRQDDMAKEAARAQVEMGVADLQRQSELDEARAASAELRMQDQQRRMWALIVGLAMLLALVGALVLVIRNRRIAAAALQTNLEMRETFITEIHHRTKNNLQLLASVVRLSSAEQDHDNANREVFTRARTMALVHEHLRLDTARQSEAVALKDYLSELVQLIDHSIGRPNIELKHEIADVEVRADQATVLGLLACEMITNAYKHAFREEDGEIVLHLGVDGEQLELSVRDTGSGFEPQASSARSTLGMQLIEDLSDQAGGNLEIDGRPGNTVFKVTGIPLVGTQLVTATQ